MAAVLGCAPGAVLSHGSAAALWGIGRERLGVIEVSTPASSVRQRPGTRLHPRPNLSACDLEERDGIPVTGLVRTLLDQATYLDPPRLERAINEADRLDLIDPEALSHALDAYSGQAGVARLRDVVDRRTFRLTDSELERRFLRLVEKAGLPFPLTGQHVTGFKVDFFWPDLGLVVETDGLRYHRTPAQQTRDQLREQAHLAAGLTPLRFNHAQVRYEQAYVRDTLLAVMRRLERERGA
jgi:very-short-patch-repair endonuclease